ncbi:MAG: error-prone DNA polymerase [Myxococcaceae bacterium]
MYAELVCRSNFSFLQGASHPEELVGQAAELGLSALALTDQDGLYGVVKAYLQARALGLKLLVGSRLTLTDGPEVVALVQDASGYANLCELISQGRLAHPKGQAGVPWQALAERAAGLLLVLPAPAASRTVALLAEAFPGRFYIGLCRTFSAGDEARLQEALALAQGLDLPCCAHNDVHTHLRERQPLQDVLAGIRHGVTVAEAGFRLFPNAERTLKGPLEMARLFQDLPEAVGRTLEVADACQFSLDSLRYQFPQEDLPEGHTAQSWLVVLVEEGLHTRYPEGVPEAVRRQIAHELALIERLQVAGYFLALQDIVRFALGRGILCQGRGSAANSAVCYALHITAIDPVRMGLLFERFLSLERPEPPDIDVDFEHERREEVLQYVYRKHGRSRAGMVCEVICYRGRLAVREVGKVLGLSLDQVDRLARVTEMSGSSTLEPAQVREAGLRPEDKGVQQTLALAAALEGFPRHLSIHVGGFVITHGELSELVPVENAAMAERTVVQWDKDDLAALGVFKVDLLGLGMLTALSKGFQLVQQHEGKRLTLATLPPEDPEVYEMLGRADAVGVFQVESRAQMNLLPRLRPRSFYDLTIEIALIRPGPILGDMVHPFLRRREGLEDVTYPSEEVKAILEKTLGIPLFQEQAMRLAVTAAGFGQGDADALRRALTHKRASALLPSWRARFIEGCVRRGYSRDYAERCFEQFKGFSHYGFPESHSASFALIAYASAYLKRYHPAAFAAALLNSQPMGFYAPHTLVEDARRHGVETRAVDVRHSDWDCTLEEGALRLGFREVRGLQQTHAQAVANGRPAGGDRSLRALVRRTGLPRGALLRLARAGALDGLCGDRRQAVWEVQALSTTDAQDLFHGEPLDTSPQPGGAPSLLERVVEDYRHTGLSLERHPVAFLREHLTAQRALSAAQLQQASHRSRVRVGGLVTCRQRPPTAKGVAFLTLEDETGMANLVVPSRTFERQRSVVLGSAFLLAEGRVERTGQVVNVQVSRLQALALRAPSRQLALLDV